MINKRLENIEAINREHEIRNFYRETNWCRKAYQPKMNNCKSKIDAALEGEREITKRWAEHFSELLNIQLNCDIENDMDEMEEKNLMCCPQPLIEKPDRDDVELAIDDLKNYKAPGRDGLVAEFIKCCSNEMKDLIYQ